MICNMFTLSHLCYGVSDLANPSPYTLSQFYQDITGNLNATQINGTSISSEFRTSLFHLVAAGYNHSMVIWCYVGQELNACPYLPFSFSCLLLFLVSNFVPVFRWKDTMHLERAPTFLKAPTKSDTAAPSGLGHGKIATGGETTSAFWM